MPSPNLISTATEKQEDKVILASLGTGSCFKISDGTIYMVCQDSKHSGDKVKSVTLSGFYIGTMYLWSEDTKVVPCRSAEAKFEF